MKKLLFALLAFSFLAVSCKNKKTAETLKGTWNEVSIDGNPVAQSAQDKLVFGDCKGGKSNKCTLTLIDGSSSNSETLTYTIENGGEYLVLHIPAFIGSIESPNTIVSLTDNSMTIDWSSADYIGEYSKQ